MIQISSQPDSTKIYPSQGCCVKYEFTTDKVIPATAYSVALPDIPINYIQDGDTFYVQGIPVVFSSEEVDGISISTNGQEIVLGHFCQVYQGDSSLTANNIFYLIRTITNNATFDAFADVMWNLTPPPITDRFIYLRIYEMYFNGDIVISLSAPTTAIAPGAYSVDSFITGILDTQINPLIEPYGLQIGKTSDNKYGYFYNNASEIRIVFDYGVDDQNGGILWGSDVFAWALVGFMNDVNGTITGLPDAYDYLYHGANPIDWVSVYQVYNEYNIELLEPIVVNANLTTFDHIANVLTTYFPGQYIIDYENSTITAACNGSDFAINFTALFEYGEFDILSEGSNISLPINYTVDVDVYIDNCVYSKVNVQPAFFLSDCLVDDFCDQNYSLVLNLDIELILRESKLLYPYTPNSTLDEVPLDISSYIKNVYIKARESYLDARYNTIYGTWIQSDEINILYSDCVAIPHIISKYSDVFNDESETTLFQNYDFYNTICCGSNFFVQTYLPALTDWAYYVQPSCLATCTQDDVIFSFDKEPCTEYSAPPDPEINALAYSNKIISNRPLTFLSGELIYITGTSFDISTTIDLYSSGPQIYNGSLMYIYNFGEIYTNTNQIRTYEVYFQDTCGAVHKLVYTITVNPMTCGTITFDIDTEQSEITPYNNIYIPEGASSLTKGLYTMNLKNVIEQYCNCAELDIHIVTGLNIEEQTFTDYVTEQPIKIRLVKGTECCCDDTLYFLGSNGIYNNIAVSCDNSMSLEVLGSNIAPCTDCEEVEDFGYLTTRNYRTKQLPTSYYTKYDKNITRIPYSEESKNYIISFFTSPDVLNSNFEPVYTSSKESKVYSRSDGKFIQGTFTLFETEIKKSLNRWL